MKQNLTNSLIGQLSRLKCELDAVVRPESKAAIVRNLDALIERLSTIRSQFADATLQERVSKVQRPFQEVIEFLESVKTDEVLGTLLSQPLQTKPARPKRIPIEISPNLTNEQIRGLLAQDLSKLELKAVAAQRGITVGKTSDEQVRRELLRVLDRQEGYERLATPRS